MKRAGITAAIALASVSAVACTTEPAEPLTGTVVERGGARLSGVTVRLAGQGATATTDARGVFSMVPEIAGAEVVQFSRAGYGTRAIQAVLDGAGATVTSTLVADAAALTVDTTTGGTFDSDGVGVVIGPGLFQSADGGLVVGTVAMSVTRVLRTAGDIQAVGPLWSAGGLIEAVAAFEVSVHQGAEVLTFRTGAGMRVNVAPASASPPDEVPVWRLDTGRAVWASAGTALLDKVTGRYAVTVDREGLWGLGAEVPTACVSGRATAAGAGVAGAWVTATPTGRGIMSGASAGGDGRFCVPVPAGAEVSVAATQGDGATASATATAGTSAAGQLPLASCAGCSDIGDVP